MKYIIYLIKGYKNTTNYGEIEKLTIEANQFITMPGGILYHTDINAEVNRENGIIDAKGFGYVPNSNLSCIVLNTEYKNNKSEV